MTTAAEHLRAAAADESAPEPLRRLAAFLAEHGAELTSPISFGEVQARSQLAHLAAAVEDFRGVCEHADGFASLAGDHPARRLFRVAEQIKAWSKTELKIQADRILHAATPAERAHAAIDIANRRAAGRPAP